MGLLTGGFDRPYAYGLSMALAAKQTVLDVIGGNEVDSPEMHTTPRLRFVNYYGDPRRDSGLAGRLSRVLGFYLSLFRYVARERPKILHILWNYKFALFDRTLLMLYFRALGKKIVFTAHNVNAGARDGNDSVLNRLTLKIQYRLCDHIFVHTPKMREELLGGFGVPENNVTVIPFGINNSVPVTGMTSSEARRRLGIREDEKVILFFGALRPYKGLEYLVSAVEQLAASGRRYRLVIASEPKKGCEQYTEQILESIRNGVKADRITARLEFVPDPETEIYFKAADVAVLPYTLVFQSGVLFLGYSFGLPAIASDVGSFAQDIVEGITGYVCKACDASDLAAVIERYFESDLYQDLDRRRDDIRSLAESGNSWNEVGSITCAVYERLLNS